MQENVNVIANYEKARHHKTNEARTCKVLDIVQSFPFIFLLYCGTHEHVYIYISPICNIVVSFFREYNKN